MKQAVEQFVKCTGNYRTLDTKEDFFEEVDKLIPLIQEELDELRESLKLRWVEGVLDDCLDLKVYNYQLQSLLERLGCDVSSAEVSVDVNNSLKYTTSKELAQKWLLEHKEQALKLGVPLNMHICITEVDGIDYYCLKRTGDGKVMKYCGFARVQLDKYVPQEFGGALGLED
jgi:hypothetical protein